MRRQFSAAVCDRLKNYVYLYVDPSTEQVFYVGKGRGARACAHLKAAAHSEKGRIISKLRKRGLNPRIEILKYGMNDGEALLVESAAIELLGLSELANQVRGHKGARASLEDVIDELKGIRARIRDRVVLINIARGYLSTMSPIQVYDRTRSAWALNPKRHRAEYALAVYRGIVREVFEIAEWVPGGSTMRSEDLTGRHPDIRGRKGFVGRVADDVVRQRYVGKSVRQYLQPGAQNPIKFVNC